MILGSYVPRIVGQVYDEPIADGDGNVHRMPSMILREATREEWVAACLENGKTEEDIARAKVGDYFYDVSID